MAPRMAAHLRRRSGKTAGSLWAGGISSIRRGSLMSRGSVEGGGVGFGLVHNHLNGDPEPSEEDLRLTAEVVAAARLLDLEFLDHLVIGRGRWASIRSQRPTIWATTAAPD